MVEVLFNLFCQNDSGIITYYTLVALSNISSIPMENDTYYFNTVQIELFINNMKRYLEEGEDEESIHANYCIALKILNIITN